MSAADVEQLSVDLRELMKFGGMPRLRRAFIAAGAKMEGRAKVNARSRMKVRTGGLSRSISFEVGVSTDSTQELTLRAAKDYAERQDQGGTSQAKAGGYLRIPLPSALTAGGVDRFPGPLRIVAPDLFVCVRGPSGLVLLNKETGEPWYVLRKTSTTPATRFMSDAVDDELAVLGEKLGAALVADIQATGPINGG